MHVTRPVCVAVAGMLALCGGTTGGGQAVTLVHDGMCDASAAVALDGGRFVVADDEDNVLHVYAGDASGPPLARVELDRFLDADPEHPEADLEGAARSGSRIYWIGSHGRSRSGKRRPGRMRFFATTVPQGDVGPAPIGRPYAYLLRDLVHEPALARFDLEAAATKAPQAPGGLNIEGLGAMPDGRLLIGFRNPIPGGLALLVPLLDPEALVSGTSSARFGAPILLDLGGRGIRDIAPFRGGYLILGGGADGGQQRLYRWSGEGSSPEALDVDLGGLSPEALVADAATASRVLLISDDGNEAIGGRRCKDLGDRALRRFRSVWIDVPAAR